MVITNGVIYYFLVIVLARTYLLLSYSPYSIQTSKHSEQRQLPYYRLSGEHTSDTRFGDTRTTQVSHSQLVEI